MSDTVTVLLTWTFGVNVGGRTEYFGPGRVPVPADVARRMGWEIVTDDTAVSDPPVSSDADDGETAVSPPSPPVQHINGVNESLAAEMVAKGFITVDDVASATAKALTAVNGIGKVTAEKLIKAARELV